MYADRQADSGRQRCRSACLSRTGGNDNEKGVDGRCTDGRPISQTSTPRYALSKSGASPRWTLDHTSTLYRLARPDIRRSWTSCMQVQGLGFTGISPPSCLRERKHRATIHREQTLTQTQSVRQRRPPALRFRFAPPPPSASSSRHTPLSLSVPCLTSEYSHTRVYSHCSSRPRRRPFTSLHLHCSCRVLLAPPRVTGRHRRAPDPGKSRAHATNISSRVRHRSLTHPQPSIVLRVLFI